MAQDLVEVFMKVFHAETNRQRAFADTAKGASNKALTSVTRKLDGLYDAIAGGLRREGLKAKLEDLERRKTALEQELSEDPSAPPLLHPNLAKLYSDKVTNLRKALKQDDLRNEALDILRKLIDRVDIGPKTDDGTRPIVLIGNIAAMIETAHNKKPASDGAGVLGPYACSPKLVAGVGFEPTTFRL